MTFDHLHRLKPERCLHFSGKRFSLGYLVFVEPVDKELQFKLHGGIESLPLEAYVPYPGHNRFKVSVYPVL